MANALSKKVMYSKIIMYAYSKAITYMSTTCVIVKLYPNIRECNLKIPSKPVRILRLTLYATQLCSGRQVDITPNPKVPIHCVFALL